MMPAKDREKALCTYAKRTLPGIGQFTGLWLWEGAFSLRCRGLLRRGFGSCVWRRGGFCRWPWLGDAQGLGDGTQVKPGPEPLQHLRQRRRVGRVEMQKDDAAGLGRAANIIHNAAG